jgi:hypothetical protein
MLEIYHLSIFRRKPIEYSVTSFRHYTSLLHEIDRIGTHDRREAVSDDDRGASLHEVVECSLYQLLSLGIQSARGLIEDEDLRVREYRSGDSYTLFLTS